MRFVRWLFKKRITVEPVGEQWGVVEYPSFFSEVYYMLRAYGIRITIGNVIWLLQNWDSSHAERFGSTTIGVKPGE